LLLAAEF